MTNKEMTAHIRRRIKQARIKVRCKGYMSCGNFVIRIDVPAYELEFSEEEQKKIRTIAQVNHLTWVQGMEIDVMRMTNPKEFVFYVPAGSTEGAR